MQRFLRRPSRAERAFVRSVFNPDLPIPEAPKLPATGKDSNYRRGLTAERWAKGVLHEEGYFCPPNAGSYGAADIFAIRDWADGPAVRAIQIKMLSHPRPDGLNDAVRDLLNIGVRGKLRRRALPATAQREAWLLTPDDSAYRLIARCVLSVAGDPTTTGEYAAEVQRSLTAMLEREHARLSKGDSLQERLKA